MSALVFGSAEANAVLEGDKWLAEHGIAVHEIRHRIAHTKEWIGEMKEDLRADEFEHFGDRLRLEDELVGAEEELARLLSLQMLANQKSQPVTAGQ